MKPIPQSLLFSIPILLLAGCAGNALPGWTEVKDPKEKAALSAQWVNNRSLKLASSYPDAAIRKAVLAGMTARKLDERNVGEMFFYTLDKDRHAIFVETDEKDGSARYHCFGLSKDKALAIYWSQFQEHGKSLKIEKMEVPGLER